RPEVVGLAVGTRPDCVPDPVLDVLADTARNKLVWVEYGLQSIHDRTLKKINRGHTSGALFDAVRRTKLRGILVVTHLILGLPGESVNDMVRTAQAVTDAGVWGVKLHPLYVVRGTALDRMYRTGDYLPLTQSEATNATLAVMEALGPDMVIHRMTSDPHPDELSAPLWMLDRKRVRTELEQAMIRTGFRQGSRQEVRQRRHM
ncbi:MAG: TIGR01212 family radical SAM protein, partial [Desulfomonilaceae bacterium]|nr:TIGR01212 family radical SAM protein [Desulfomonilaceae bacterium]